MNIKRVAGGLGAVTLLGSGILAPFAVFADSADDLVTCASGNATKTCTLSSDVTLTSKIVLTSDLTVDMNGHNINATETASLFETRGYALNLTGSGKISTTNATNSGVIRVYGTNEVDTEDKTYVNIGKDVTVEGPNAIVIYNNNGTAYNTTVDVYGTLNGHNSGIWLIGSIKDKNNYPTINIYDGAVVKADGPIGTDDKGNVEGGIALSAMGYAKWDIAEATIEGVGSGIGLKGGIMNIEGADVKGTGDASESLPPEFYNNGMNASGAAIQIEENAGYPGGIELSIDSGSFTSDYNDGVIYRYGEVDGAVKSITLSGGVYNREIDEPAYLAEGYTAYEKPQGTWTVDKDVKVDLPEKIVLAKGETYTFDLGEIASKYAVTGIEPENGYASMDGFTITGEAAGETFVNVKLVMLRKGIDATIPVYVYDINDEDADVYAQVEQTSVNPEDLDEETKAIIDKAVGERKVAGLYDIDIKVYVAGNTAPVAEITDTQPIEVSITKPEGLPELKDGYIRKFYVVRYHDGAATTIEAVDNGDFVSFFNDKFSTFALVYEDIAKEVAPVTPDTGTYTAQAASANIAAIATAAFVGVITMVGSLVLLTRKH